MSETLPAAPATPVFKGLAGALSWASYKRLLRTIHLWTGMVLCLPMVLIGLSGSALLAQREILWLQGTAATGTGERQPLTRVVAAAQASMPDFRANWIQLPPASGRPASVQFIVANRPTRTMEVLVDPVSLKLLGSDEIVQRGPIMRSITDMHEFLMLQSDIGLRVVGWMAIAMTVMGLSGLVLWWPRKGRWLAAFLVKRGARGLRLHLDLHHAAGIWGLFLFLILSISGIYLAFPRTVSGIAQTTFSREVPDAKPLPPGFPSVWPMDADQAVAAARIAVPDARPVGVKLPRPPDGLLMVQMEAQGLAPSIPPITVTFDPRGSRSVHIDDPRYYPAADRALNTLYALHFSVGMGGVWTFLVFLAGLLPTFLAVTGLTIWWKKRRNRVARRAVA